MKTKISGMGEKEAFLESLRRYKETLLFNYRSKSRGKVHAFIDTMTSDQCLTAPIDYSQIQLLHVGNMKHFAI